MVGDLPLHACFLLGLSDMGKDLIKKFYGPKNKEANINTPYKVLV